MVSLIIRARNRLEYSVRVLNHLAVVRRLYPGEVFETVLVDNASDDGTQQWVDWVKRHENPSKWFGPINYVRSEKNLGDFGGLAHGIMNHAQGEYVAQLDNDAVFDPRALGICRAVLENNLADVVMPRRKGVTRRIEAKNQRTVKLAGHSDVRLGDVGFCVMFYIMRTEDARKRITTGATNARSLTAGIGRCAKLLGISATQLEGEGSDVGGVNYAQFTKYSGT